MQALDKLIRIRKRRLDELRREIGTLEALAADLVAKSTALEGELRIEQRIAAGNADAGFAYGGYAQAVIERRGRIAASRADVDERLTVARNAASEAFEEMKRLDTILQNQTQQRHQAAQRREQATLDEIALEQYRRAS